ncbi:MAG: fibronectin type III domain-containing protein, partial [Armatimonadota bacterium]
MRTFLCLAVCFLVVSWAGAVVVYDGSVHPSLAGWTPAPESGCVWQDAVVDDPQAVDGKADFINDSSSAKTKTILAAPPSFDVQQGVTVVGRVKCTAFSGSRSNSTLNFAFYCSQGRNNVTIGYDSTNNKQYARITSGSVPGGGNNYVDLSPGYHVYRLTFQEDLDGTEHWRLYIDENPSPALVYDGAATSTTSWNSPVFGSGDTSRTQQIYFDYISYDNTGAFAPGTKVLIIGGPSAVVSGNDATISWMTDVPATSTVYYGTDPNNLNLVVSDSAEVTSHSLVLTGLSPTQTWYYKIVSAKAGLASAESDVLSLSVGISNLKCIPHRDTADITWLTSLPATTTLWYGMDPDNLNQSITDPNPATSHAMTLTGLTPGGNYFYKIRCESPVAFPGETLVESFRTYGIGEVENPSFEAGYLSPWIVTYGSNDGVRSGAWYNNMGWGRPAEAGAYFLGQAASWGTKRSVTSQLVPCNPSTYYIVSGWIYTCSWSEDGT